MIIVASCFRNQDELQPDGSLSSYADFTPFLLEYLAYKTNRGHLNYDYILKKLIDKSLANRVGTVDNQIGWLDSV